MTTPTLLRALRTWTEAAIEGTLHPLVVSTICGARLFPLKKNKRGDVRPIAVGEVLLRVTEKILSKLPLTTESMSALLPLQTAFAGRSTCEQVGLTIQALVTRTLDSAG